MTPFPIHPFFPEQTRMALERTLSIIKPDAVAKNVIGEIYARFEKAGLKIVAARMKQLSRQEAEGFYAVHRERPFFSELTKFMSTRFGNVGRSESSARSAPGPSAAR